MPTSPCMPEMAYGVLVAGRSGCGVQPFASSVMLCASFEAMVPAELPATTWRSLNSSAFQVWFGSLRPVAEYVVFAGLPGEDAGPDEAAAAAFRSTGLAGAA